MAGLAGRARRPGAPTGRRCTGSPERCAGCRGSGRRRSRVRAPALYSPGERAELAAIAAAQRDPVKRSSALALAVFGIGAGRGPASWWRCAAMTSSRTAAGRDFRRGWPRGLVPVTPDYACRARRWSAARAATSCSAPARPTAAIRTCQQLTRGLTAEPAAPRLSLRGPGPPSSAAPWPRSPRSRCCWLSPDREAGSLARYARHLVGVSSSKAPCGPAGARSAPGEPRRLTLPPTGGRVSGQTVAFAAGLIDRSGKAPVIEAALAYRTGVARARPLPVRAGRLPPCCAWPSMTGLVPDRRHPAAVPAATEASPQGAACPGTAATVRACAARLPPVSATASAPSAR